VLPRHASTSCRFDFRCRFSRQHLQEHDTQVKDPFISTGLASSSVHKLDVSLAEGAAHCRSATQAVSTISPGRTTFSMAQGSVYSFPGTFTAPGASAAPSPAARECQSSGQSADHNAAVTAAENADAPQRGGQAHAERSSAAQMPPVLHSLVSLGVSQQALTTALATVMLSILTLTTLAAIWWGICSILAAACAVLRGVCRAGGKGAPAWAQRSSAACAPPHHEVIRTLAGREAHQSFSSCDTAAMSPKVRSRQSAWCATKSTVQHHSALAVLAGQPAHGCLRVNALRAHDPTFHSSPLKTLPYTRIVMQARKDMQRLRRQLKRMASQVDHSEAQIAELERVRVAVDSALHAAPPHATPATPRLVDAMPRPSTDGASSMSSSPAQDWRCGIKSARLSQGSGSPHGQKVRSVHAMSGPQRSISVGLHEQDRHDASALTVGTSSRNLSTRRAGTPDQVHSLAYPSPPVHSAPLARPLQAYAAKHASTPPSAAHHTVPAPHGSSWQANRPHCPADAWAMPASSLPHAGNAPTLLHHFAQRAPDSHPPMAQAATAIPGAWPLSATRSGTHPHAAPVLPQASMPPLSGASSLASASVRMPPLPTAGSLGSAGQHAALPPLPPLPKVTPDALPTRSPRAHVLRSAVAQASPVLTSLQASPHTSPQSAVLAPPALRHPESHQAARSADVSPQAQTVPPATPWHAIAATASASSPAASPRSNAVAQPGAEPPRAWLGADVSAGGRGCGTAWQPPADPAAHTRSVPRHSSAQQEAGASADANPPAQPADSLSAPLPSACSISPHQTGSMRPSQMSVDLRQQEAQVRRPAAQAAAQRSSPSDGRDSIAGSHAQHATLAAATTVSYQQSDAIQLQEIDTEAHPAVAPASEAEHIQAARTSMHNVPALRSASSLPTAPANIRPAAPAAEASAAVASPSAQLAQVQAQPPDGTSVHAPAGAASAIPRAQRAFFKPWTPDNSADASPRCVPHGHREAPLPGGASHLPQPRSRDETSSSARSSARAGVPSHPVSDSLQDSKAGPELSMAALAAGGSHAANEAFAV
jgi:hypothetical protein